MDQHETDSAHHRSSHSHHMGAWEKQAKIVDLVMNGQSLRIGVINVKIPKVTSPLVLKVLVSSALIYVAYRNGARAWRALADFYRPQRRLVQTQDIEMAPMAARRDVNASNTDSERSP